MTDQPTTQEREKCPHCGYPLGTQDTWCATCAEAKNPTTQEECDKCGELKPHYCEKVNDTDYPLTFGEVGGLH